MKFSVSVDDLRSALEKAKTTISQKDIQPVLKNFCMKVKDGTLSIVATDLDLATVCKIDVQDSEDGDITVPGQKFIDIVAFAGDPTLDFKLEDTKVTITVGKFTSVLNSLPADDYPTIVEFDSSDVKKADRQTFLDGLNRISFSISDNEARKNLLAVYINAGYLQASDGHVTSVISVDFGIEDTLIPAQAVTDLIRVLRASKAVEIEFATTDSFLMFKLDNDLFITRLSQAKFPDIPNKILKPTESNPIVLKVSKGDLVSAVKRVAITANAKSLAIHFSVKEGELTMVSNDVDGNTSNEVIPVVSNIAEFEFILNYNYILDICNSLVKDEVEFKMHDNIRVPIRIQEDEFITLLMRLSLAVKKQLEEGDEQKDEKYWEKNKATGESFDSKKASASKRSVQQLKDINASEDADVQKANARSRKVVAGEDEGGRLSKVKGTPIEEL